MRHFSSYGPVDPSEDFCVERRELVEGCVAKLVANPDKGGHYFTIWGPRQTGKTWIMRQAIAEVRARYGDRFRVGSLSMQGVIVDDDSPDEAFFTFVPHRFEIGFGVEAPLPADWDSWTHLFARRGGYFDRPVILCIDEFDSLPKKFIDRLVALFRDIYLNREGYLLHGLALIGVRAVLGVDSPRGSPFNVQRSLQIPNLTRDEVREMFAQYRASSGQEVEPAVADAVFDATRGQPGLVSWFGELCTEKYNPGPPLAITLPVWEKVDAMASQVEWSNTTLNLLKKARRRRSRVVQLFTDPNVPFDMGKTWCSYLYMNGIIDEAPAPNDPSGRRRVCRFSSPFVQKRLYSALSSDMFGYKGPLLAIEPRDTLDDVFTPTALCVPPLLERYRGYLKRLAARGIDPWQGQPRRADLHMTEAVGHFHLYAWLRDAVERRCTISPEFPTGNGKVDLVLTTRDGHVGVIEGKSFIDMYELGEGRAQAAGYAKKLGLAEATLAVFIPVPQKEVPPGVAGKTTVNGVKVTVVAFGWVDEEGSAKKKARPAAKKKARPATTVKRRERARRRGRGAAVGALAGFVRLVSRARRWGT